jgi:hypothetical protein
MSDIPMFWLRLLAQPAPRQRTAAELAAAAAAAACELRTALKQVPLSLTASRTSMMR